MVIICSTAVENKYAFWLVFLISFSLISVAFSIYSRQFQVQSELYLCGASEDIFFISQTNTCFILSYFPVGHLWDGPYKIISSLRAGRVLPSPLLGKAFHVLSDLSVEFLYALWLTFTQCTSSSFTSIFSNALKDPKFSKTEKGTEEKSGPDLRKAFLWA